MSKMNEVDAVNHIKQCCDEITPLWEKYFEYWEDEDIEVQNEMSVLAHYVVDQYALSKTGDFTNIFNACEKVYECGDEKALELVGLWFVEDILFISSHAPFGTQVFEPWMQKATLEDYVSLRNYFERLANDAWVSYHPVKKLYLKTKRWLRWW